MIILAISTLIVNIIAAATLLADGVTTIQQIIWLVSFLLILQTIFQILLRIGKHGRRFLMKDRSEYPTRDGSSPYGYRIEQYLGQRWQRIDNSENEIFVPLLEESPMMELDEKTRKIIRAIQKWDNRKRYFNTMTLEEHLGREFGFIGGKPVMPTSSFYNYREKYYKFLNKDENGQDSNES